MRSAWTRQLGPTGHNCGSLHHHSSGWSVQHCGHPTALWPWFLRSDLWPGLEVVSFNGLGFKSGEVAKAVVEGILSGRFHVTTDRCTARVARVRDVTTFGDLVEDD